MTNLDMSEAIGLLAQEKGCTPSQLALAWVLHQNNTFAAGAADGFAIVPLPGTKKRRHLLDNVGAIEVELTDDDMSAIESASPVESPASGTRYPEFRMGELNQ